MDPTVIALVSDGSVYTNDDGYYILADSDLGSSLLEDSATYSTITVEGNFYRMAGADAVIPFKSGSGFEIVSVYVYSGLINHSAGYLRLKFKLTDLNKSGIVLSGSPSMSAVSNCKLSGSKFAVTEKNSPFIIQIAFTPNASYNGWFNIDTF